MTIRERFESWWDIHCRRLPVHDPKELSWWWYSRQAEEEDEEDPEAET